MEYVPRGASVNVMNESEQEPVEAEVVEYSRRGVIRREIDPVLLPWGVSDDDYEDGSPLLAVVCGCDVAAPGD